MNKKPAGFSLVELMVVVAIVAILGGIALAAYQTYITRSQFSESLSLSSGISRTVLEQYWQTGECAASGTSGIPAGADVAGTYVASVTAGGTATATGGCEIVTRFRAAGVSAPLQGKSVKLLLQADSAAGSWWICTSDVATRYLPDVCSHVP